MKRQLESITISQFKEFWAGLDKELDSFGTRNMYDILNSAIYIKGLWDNGKLVAVGGLCGVFCNTVLTTFHIVDCGILNINVNALLVMPPCLYSSLISYTFLEFRREIFL